MPMYQMGRWFGYTLSLAILSPQVSSICYYPNGDVTPSDVPCLPGNEASWCCGSGYACLSNKICMYTDQTPLSSGQTKYVRGSCTDRTWRSSNCPSFCVNPNSPYQDNTAGGEGMAICPNTTDSFYCIDFDESAVDCAKGLNLAVQGTVSPSVLTIINYASSTTSTSSSSHTTSKRVASAPSKATPSSTTHSWSSSSTSTGTIVGAAVGSVVGVSIIILGGYLLYRHRRIFSTAATNPNKPTWFTTSPPPQRYQSDQEVAAKYRSYAHEVYVLPPELDGGHLAEMSAGSPTVAR